MDCPLFPDECDYVVEHLVSDDRTSVNQKLSNRCHGLWEERFWAGLDGKGEIRKRIWYRNGVLHGWSQLYYMNGQLKEEGNYVYGRKRGIWKFWDGTGRLRKGKDFGSE